MNDFKRIMLMIALIMSTLMIIFPTNSAVAQSGSWTTGFPLTQNIGSSSLIIGVGDKIYFFNITSTYIYNPPNGALTNGASIPSEKIDYLLAATSIQDKIYIAGHYQNKGIFYGTIKEYNTNTDTWSTINSPPLSICEGGLNNVDKKIYALTEQHYIEVYDSVAGNWSVKSHMPGVFHGFSAVVNEKIYFVSTAATFIYNTETDTWSNGTPIPYIDSNLPPSNIGVTSGVYAPKRIYCIGGGWPGGYDWTGYHKSSYVNHNYVYDPTDDSWDQATPMPTARNPYVTVINDKIYAIGNSADGSMDVVEVYTPEGYSSTPLVTSAPPSSGSSSSVEVPFSEIVTVGGIVIAAFILAVTVTLLYRSTHKKTKTK
jgi:hypothetical protein